MKGAKNAVSLEIKEIDHSSYKNFYLREAPFFLVGDNISGKIRVFVQKGSILKHRGIYVSLDIKLYHNAKELETRTLQTLQILHPSSLNDNFEGDFEFNTNALPASYVGSKYSYVYCVHGYVKTLLSQISEHKYCHILNPLTLIRTEELPSISLNNEFIQASFYISQNFIENDSLIDGNFVISKILSHHNEEIESIYIQLINKEIYKDNESNVILLNYQIQEGNPKDQVSFPIFLSISHLKIWPPPIQFDFSFSASYKIRFICKLISGKEIASEESNISIVQKAFT